jgi:hypothetical protein
MQWAAPTSTRTAAPQLLPNLSCSRRAHTLAARGTLAWCARPLWGSDRAGAAHPWRALRC